MPDVPEIRLRLSIWRPASLDRTYLHAQDGGSGSDRYSPLDETGLLEQIYSWDSGRYDILGSSEPDVTDLIRSRLLLPFSQHEGVRRFRRALSDLLEDSQVRAGTFWSDCPETVPTGSGDLSLRSNVTLGVLRHFLWVAGIYADVPDASVLLR